MVAYFGLCSFLDNCVGTVLETLAEVGLADDTRIVYTSDHGELLGDHGQWTKMSMYESSVGIPMIFTDVEGESGTVCETPVNLIDSYQTILDCVGLPLTEQEQNELPGSSLYDIALGAEPDRVTFSEYHDGGTTRGHFMLRYSDRDGDWKFVYYVGCRPQLFNLANDPQELDDLATDAAYAEVLAMCEIKLREIVDPEAADGRAHEAQRKRVEELGGRDAVLGLIGDFGFTPIDG